MYFRVHTSVQYRGGGIGESRNLMLRSYGCRYELHLRLWALQKQNLYTSFVCEGKGTVIQHTIGLYSFVPSCFRDTRDVPGIVVWPGMQCQLTRGWTIDAWCRLKQTDCKYNWEPNGTFNAVHFGICYWAVLSFLWFIVLHEVVTWELHCHGCSPKLTPNPS